MVVVKRNRVKHTLSFEQRLANEAARLREAANALPDGSRAQETLLKRAWQTDKALELNLWLSSPGLQPPADLAELISSKK
jgi:hypothetical protein